MNFKRAQYCGVLMHWRDSTSQLEARAMLHNRRTGAPASLLSSATKRFTQPRSCPTLQNDSVAASNIQRLAWTSNKNNFPQLDALLIHMDKYTVTTIYVSNWTRYQKYNGRGKGRVATLGSGLGQVGDRHRQPMQGFL